VVEISNPARARLQADQLAIGLGLRQARTVDIAAAMRTCGFDWLFIDLEHNSMTLDMAVQIAVAAKGAGISPIVRVPNRQYDMATRALDGGAFGIVMPHVDSAEEAREVADRLRYPPLGRRSVAGAMAQFDFQPVPLAEATATFNAVLLIGTNDLAMEMGIPGQFMHADIERAYAAVIAACRKHGKWAGMGGVYTEAGLSKYIGMGIRMILSGNDFSFLMAAGSARAKFVRELKP